MNTATDKELGGLHKQLADSMVKALKDSSKAVDLINAHTDENGENDIPGDVLAFLSTIANTNPALLTACAKFLKDNDITCAPADSEGLSKLEELIQNKQRSRKRVGNVIPIEE